MQRMSRLPRWMHYLWALVGNYAWGPCALCARPFGGHEWKEYNGLSATITSEVRPGGRTGKAICPMCTRAGLGDLSWKRPEW